MAFQRGDVVLVPFPYSDLSGAKARPAVVLSSAAYQEVEPDVLVAAITSNLAGTSEYDYRLDGWRKAGLVCPSALKPVIATIEPGRVLQTVGHLTPGDLAEVDSRIKSALGL